MGFMLEIVTPERSFYEGEVARVIVKGIEGEMAILKNRAPIITPLAIGKIRILKDGEEKVAAAVNGYISVDKEKTTIITDSCEWPEEIDIARAEDAKMRAENRIKDSSKFDEKRAKLALSRALVRIDIKNNL